MGLGYEGWVKIGDKYALGTGMSVPRGRVRLESASGYGGKIGDGPGGADMDKIGINLPYNYDWEQFDGSLSMEVWDDFYNDELYDWIFDRQSSKPVIFSTRSKNVQKFDDTYWSTLSISASEGSVVSCSLGFVAVTRDEYVYGEEYINNKKGNRPDDGSAEETELCTLIAGGPPPLDGDNVTPIPYWNTKLVITDMQVEPLDVLTWSLDFNQDVVKFFGCTDTGSGSDPGAVEPLFLAMGPMASNISFSYMLFDDFPDDTLDPSTSGLDLYIADKKLTLKRLEATTENDEIPSLDALVPLNVEYAIYEIANA